MAAGAARTIGPLAMVLLILVVGAAGGFFILLERGIAPPVPGQQRCVATADGRTVAVDLDQAHYASIIVGLSVRRGLAPRAATIAMATVYQESGIRNLDYGDRDSLGLFQQRPSQGWGTAEQLTDPYYATNRFYDALVKVDGWQERDVTEVAQQVQRSAYPDAYRDHEADARVLASVLTGHSPGGWTCLERTARPGKPVELVRGMRKTFGTVSADRSGATITVNSPSATRSWAYANFAMANSKHYGVTRVVVGDREWRLDAVNLPTWSAADPAQPDDTVVITVRA